MISEKQSVLMISVFRRLHFFFFFFFFLLFLALFHLVAKEESKNTGKYMYQFKQFS